MCSFRVRGVACLAVGLAILCSAAAVRGEEGKLLRWKFRAGDKTEMVMTQEIGMKMTLQNQPMKVMTTTIMDLCWTVREVDPQGTAKFEQTFERARIKMEGLPGMGMDYDTASDKKPEGFATTVAPLFQTVIGKPFVFTMDAQGNALEVKLPEGLQDAVSKLPGGAGMAGMFTEEGMKNMVQMASLPEKAVRPGDTWNRQTTMKDPALGDMTVDTTWRYVGIENRHGKQLEKIAMQVKMQYGEGKEAKVKIKNQDNQGAIYFDRQKGLLVESISESKLTMQMSVQGQNIEQELETKQTFVRKPEESSAKTK